MTLTEAILKSDKETLANILLKIKDEYPQLKFQLLHVYRESLRRDLANAVGGQVHQVSTNDQVVKRKEGK